MRLRAVLIRFYKSFNFDYLRKYDPKTTDRPPWEMCDGMWYPYVRVPIDRCVTTVVGANESGKTHLLTAIEKGLSGAGIARGDFCRYSQFFVVEEGRMRWPDFGFEWTDLTVSDRAKIAEVIQAQVPASVENLFLFRTDRTKLTLYVPQRNSYGTYEVAGQGEGVLGDLLPRVFRLQENVALPESVSIRWLAADESAGNKLELLGRRQRVGLFERVLGNPPWFASRESVAQSAEQISSTFREFEGSSASTESGKRAAEASLARDLIRKVARIDKEALRELLGALRDGKDAFANSIIEKINAALKARLNFPQWWAQDREFQLLVSPREYDLAFTIRDRTEVQYSFEERSSGLRYFLSYYIQYLAFERDAGRPELLLMDEPDAFLSSQGQQDLLKIFEAFANPDDGGQGVQVVYVTHSPFLIDKNHGERIRVVEKGVRDEGTRVVRDASKNHYEPLRSAFGSFVGETTFMGNCNLMVEGPSDQILLATAAGYLRSLGVSELETLDLNHITIVPASGASHMPYLVYLARGRDVERPAVIVLLDSDESGNEAKRGIERGGPRRKELLKPEFVLQVGDLDSSGLQGALGGPLVETEDLLPLSLCVEAARRYLIDVIGTESKTAELVTEDRLRAVPARSVFQALEDCLRELSPEYHVEKIGYARAVADVLATWRRREDELTRVSSGEYVERMKVLFRKLRDMQRRAERELISERVASRINRAKKSFLSDHPNGARREHAYLLLEEIEMALDDSGESDAIRLELQALRREFEIDETRSVPIDNYAEFTERLERLEYAGRIAAQDPDEEFVRRSRRSRRVSKSDGFVN